MKLDLPVLLLLLLPAAAIQTLLPPLPLPVPLKMPLLPAVALRWSGEYFPGAEQPFTVLGETVEGCVGFGFEYQLIAENTSNKSLVFGPRTVYVRSGGEWTAVGTFPYSELGAVRVQVWLPEPMAIDAIATIADCRAPNMFDFRQTARDFLLAEAAGS